MKKSIITTEFKTPRYDRWSKTTEQNEKERNDFENGIVKLLELPENWKDYFKFDSSDDFITLQENKSYKADVYRRFKRGNVATIPSELKERLSGVIEWKNNDKNAANDKSLRESGYRQMLSVLTDLNGSNNEWHFHYYNEDKGLMISLMAETERWDGEMQYTTIAEAYIQHSGKITPPKFSCCIKYNASINEMQSFIDEYKEVNDKIMAKAEEIKSQLPTEFFTPKTN